MKLTIILKNNKKITGKFISEKNSQISLSDAYFHDMLSLIFEISIKNDDMLRFFGIPDGRDGNINDEVEFYKEEQKISDQQKIDKKSNKDKIEKHENSMSNLIKEINLFENNLIKNNDLKEKDMNQIKDYMDKIKNLFNEEKNLENKLTNSGNLNNDIKLSQTNEFIKTTQDDKFLIPDTKSDKNGNEFDLTNDKQIENIIESMKEIVKNMDKTILEIECYPEIRQATANDDCISKSVENNELEKSKHEHKEKVINISKFDLSNENKVISKKICAPNRRPYRLKNKK